MSLEMVRWGGLAGVAAGLMFLLSVILTLIAAPQIMLGSLSYYLIEVVLLAAFALTLVTITSLHALQRGRYGRLGAAGSLLTFVGYAIVLVSAHLITVVVRGAAHSRISPRRYPGLGRAQREPRVRGGMGVDRLRAVIAEGHGSRATHTRELTFGELSFYALGWK